MRVLRRQASGSTRSSQGLCLLLLAGGTWERDGDRRAAGALPHDGVLTRHPPVEGAVELGTEGQLGHVGPLLLAQDDTLLGQSLVLHALEALLDVGDLGRGRVGGLDGGGARWRHAVCAHANRCAGLHGFSGVGLARPSVSFGPSRVRQRPACVLCLKHPMYPGGGRDMSPLMQCNRVAVRENSRGGKRRSGMEGL